MRRTVLSAVAAALVLAACGGGSDGGAEPVAAPEAADAPAEAPVAEATPGRTVALASGSTVDLDSLAGQDVLLWFWAPW